MTVNISLRNQPWQREGGLGVGRETVRVWEEGRGRGVYRDMGQTHPHSQLHAGQGLPSDSS
jgi:hypothetical protein